MLSYCGVPAQRCMHASLHGTEHVSTTHQLLTLSRVAGSMPITVSCRLQAACPSPSAVEQNSWEMNAVPAALTFLRLALLQVHIAKGVVTADEMREMIEELENYGSRGLGSRLIAKAWVDPAFKAKLLKDGESLIFASPGCLHAMYMGPCRHMQGQL